MAKLRGAGRACFFVRQSHGEVRVSARPILDSPMNEQSPNLRWPAPLIATHFAAGIVAGLCVDANSYSMFRLIANTVFTAVIGAQLGLLGLATAAVVEPSPTRGKRLAWIAAATLWIWLLVFVVLISSKPVRPPIFVTLLAPPLSLAAISFGLLLRASGVRLVRLNGDSSLPGAEAFRFDLRHLFGLIAAISILLGVGRAIRDSALSDAEGNYYRAAAVLLVVSLLTAAMAVTALWAMLGAGRPRDRAPIAVVLAAAASTIPPYAFDRPLPAYFILALVAVLLSVVTLATLSRLRSAGFRLICRPPPVQ
jgi:hypothetical protein